MTDFLRAVGTGGNIQGKVLITTRLLPSALEPSGARLVGCRKEELTALAPDDALALFRTEKIEGSDAEIKVACERYGYHPLSLRLLVGWVKNDFKQPKNIRAAEQLNIVGDLIQQKHHVLEQSYERLPSEARNMLHMLACFRSSVPYNTLHNLGQPDSALHDLIERGLVQRVNLPAVIGHPSSVVLDLHPIVRGYIYARMNDDARIQQHMRLRDYFAAREAPAKVQTVEDLQPVIELYHHTLRTGQLDAAFALFRDRLSNPLYFQFGAYDMEIELLRELFPDGEDRPPRLKEESVQAWALNRLANSYSLSGQPHRAVPLFEVAVALYGKSGGSKKNLAIGLGNVANVQTKIGALHAAEANLRRSIMVCHQVIIELIEFDEAIEHRQLGYVLSYRGVWAEAEQELAKGLQLFEKKNSLPAQSLTWALRALRALLIRRDSPLTPALSPQRGEGAEMPAALPLAQRALELVDETARTRFPVERDYVQVHWLLGAAWRAEKSDLVEAQRHLDEALLRCRRVNMADMEGNILIEMARVSTDRNDDVQAEQLAREALGIAERCGYVLQQADAHLELAKVYLRGKANGKDLAGLARYHAERARDCAFCDGPPDYTYKVAYDEAVALLAGMG